MSLSPLSPPTLRRVCAWCNGTIEEGGDPTTHDICGCCSKTHFGVRIDFDKLLPKTGDHPPHAAFRQKLLGVLKSNGEIIPAAESALGRLWDLVNSEDSSIHECVEVIELDPSLVTRVFRLANSAAIQGNAATTSEAVLLLGFSRIRHVAFNTHIFNQFSKLKLPHEWDRFWLRNLLVARLAERVCGFYFPPNGTEYLAGLLRDVGWPLLAHFFPQEFEAVFSSPRPMAEAERLALPFSHARIAAAICARSSLPLRVVNAVAQHHAPPLGYLDPRTDLEKSPQFLAVVLNLCDQLADCCAMQTFEKKNTSFKNVEESPEGVWLAGFGRTLSYPGLVEEEWRKAQELFPIFSGEAAPSARNSSRK